jgi:two-component system phosphate regulon sensor histidine kinase PhoR
LPLEEVRADVDRLWRSILTAGLIIAALAAVLALVVAERIARPVRQLTEAVEEMSLSTRGLPRNGATDFSAPSGRPREGSEVPGDAVSQVAARDEVGQLTQAFDFMATQLRSQVATLVEERGRLAAVLDHMADGVIITDATGQVQLINAATARLLGTTPERALGRSFAQVVPHHQLIELVKRCREEGEEQVETVEISHPELFLQAIVTPFADPEADSPKGARGTLIILQDLTRIRRLETVRRDFISNISHELRTPLAGLKALVDTLRGGAIKDPPAAKRFLKRMDSEVDTLTQLVQELLELSRLESGQAPLQLGPTLVNEIVVPPTERLRPQASRAGLSLYVSVPKGLPRVRADAEQAQMVVTNLVHNALKFTSPGGRVTVAAAVQEAASGQPAAVLISVRDTGVGIAAEDLPRIFERFYKADRARSGGGTGLGLAIAKHIVQSHGGQIWAESVEGQGSTFFFTLPVAEPS